MRTEPLPEVDAIAHAMIGIAMEVHRHLGPGYVESFYEEAVAEELSLRGMRFERQVPVEVFYKDRVIGVHRVDLIVEGVLVVELKAIALVGELQIAQVLSYLKTTELSLGLAINFNVPLLRLGIRRVVLT